MLDFRIVYAKTALKYSFIRPIRGFQPPSIAIVGIRLNETEEVIYNGIDVTDFMIASPTLLIVRIPPSQVGKDLNELRVLSSPKRLGGDASVKLGLTTPTRTISGIDRLVQSFLMVFLSTPGSDAFNRTSGGGALGLVGKTSDKVHSSIGADLAVAVDRAKQEITKAQAKNSRMPPEEKLLSVSLDNVKFDQGSTVVTARISIKNMLGEEALVTTTR